MGAGSTHILLVVHNYSQLLTQLEYVMANGRRNLNFHADQFQRRSSHPEISTRDPCEVNQLLDVQ